MISRSQDIEIWLNQPFLAKTALNWSQKCCLYLFMLKEDKKHTCAKFGAWRQKCTVQAFICPTSSKVKELS